VGVGKAEGARVGLSVGTTMEGNGVGSYVGETLGKDVGVSVIALQRPLAEGARAGLDGGLDVDMDVDMDVGAVVGESETLASQKQPLLDEQVLLLWQNPQQPSNGVHEVQCDVSAAGAGIYVVPAGVGGEDVEGPPACRLTSHSNLKFPPDEENASMVKKTRTFHRSLLAK
jgi:hypothetical protein